MSKEKTTDKVLNVKGRSLCAKEKSYTGTVVSTKMQKTVVVEWERKVFIPKYERYLKRKTRVSAHQPEGMEITEGDMVKIHTCRPLSKTVHHVVMENLGQEKNYLVTKEGKEESRSVHDKPAKVEKESEVEETIEEEKIEEQKE